MLPSYPELVRTVRCLQEKLSAVVGGDYTAGDGLDLNIAEFSVDSTVARKTLTLSQFAATTSLELKTLLSDETGSGQAVFATSPTLVTPRVQYIFGTSAWPVIETEAPVSAVNWAKITSAITGGTVTISAFSVTDTNVSLTLAGQGTGPTILNPSGVGSVLIGTSTDTGENVQVSVGVNKLFTISDGFNNGIPTTSAVIGISRSSDGVPGIMSIGVDGNNSILSSRSDNYWYSNGVKAMTLTESRNLLIGTAVDTGEKLQIAGNGLFTGKVTAQQFRSFDDTKAVLANATEDLFQIGTYGGSQVCGEMSVYSYNGAYVTLAKYSIAIWAGGLDSPDPADGIALISTNHSSASGAPFTIQSTTTGGDTVVSITDTGGTDTFIYYSFTATKQVGTLTIL